MPKNRLEAFSDGIFAFAATLLALWQPLISAGMYAAIAIFYVAESSIFGRR